MTARARAEAKGPVERLHERIVAGDRGWFFARIADRVAERRNAMGLSQRQLAELCGTTQSAIARLERGGRPPRIDTLLRIAEALDCELVVELGLQIRESIGCEDDVLGHGIDLCVDEGRRNRFVPSVGTATCPRSPARRAS